MFSDDLIKKGAQGGREGAQLLSCAANEFVAQTLPHLNNPRVLVRIYANVRGTAEALCKTGVIDKPALFDDFIRSFNSSKVLFDFVDAGGRKNATGDKLGELLKLYLYDCHCECPLLFKSVLGDHYIRFTPLPQMYAQLSREILSTSCQPPYPWRSLLFAATSLQ
jgi:hypothetical protein